MRLQKGFTLIELLVVISIIGMLSSVVLVAVSSARTTAINSRVNQTVRQYTFPIQQYQIDNGFYPYVVDVSNTISSCMDQDTCVLYGSSYERVPEMKTLLQKSLPTLNPISTKTIQMFTLDFRGLWYSCIQVNAENTKCLRAILVWPLENGKRCDVYDATVGGSGNGHLLCFLYLN